MRTEDNLPSPEYQRDADDGGNLHMTPPVIPILPDTVEPDLELEMQLSKEKAIDTSDFNDIVDHGGTSSPPKQTQPQESFHSEPHQEPVQDNLGSHVSYGECFFN